MRVAVLSSGGKDSAAAWWWAQCRGWTVVALVTVRIEGDDSPMFQIPSTHVVEQQAELAEIPWISFSTSGETPQDVDDLAKALASLDVDGFVSGALRSDYQKSRLERMAESLNLISWTPLWHQNGYSHLRDMVQHGFKIMLTGISAEGLDEKWLGHTLTVDSVEELNRLAQRYRFNVEGEGGEYETLVLSGPHHDGEIVVEATSHWDGVRGMLTIH
ncbi:MAG: diphthine--ammonia ligase [Candidatus Poseidonia sp.]|nr:diphthine--ammonia ligase [Poseidonia sp.]